MAMSGFCLCASTFAADDVSEPHASPGPAEIEVRMRGALSVASKEVVTDDARKSDEPADARLLSATVMAGGRPIELDWNHSDRIRDELYYWRVIRHGDLRLVHATVTGRLEFRPDPAGTNSDDLLGSKGHPVVVVRSLFVQLVDGAGKPRGPQPRTKGVIASDEEWKRAAKGSQPF
ncbi:MAG: hypothetical protein Fues2KO_46400 [Fuerstiella sp.]